MVTINNQHQWIDQHKLEEAMTMLQMGAPLSIIIKAIDIPISAILHMTANEHF